MRLRRLLASLVVFASIARNAGELIEAEYDAESDLITFKGQTYTKYSEPMAESVMGSKRRSSDYAFHVFCTFACILFAGLAAGLTMGLVSLDPFDMKILMEANEADCLTEVEREELRKEKACAENLYPLVSRHHLLLVTLLLMNSIANEALPLFLNEIVPPAMALVLSVTAVLIFGEILPSAIFTGPNQLTIGSALAPLVWFFIYCFWIVSYPISLVLDKMLGEEHKGRYNKAEFRALINLHNEATEADATAEAGMVDEELGNIGQPGLAGLRAELGARQILNRSGVAKQELRIMTGALELHRLRVKDVMLPLDEVFMLAMNTKLDVNILESIVDRGHSRIPVFEGHPHNIRGMLLVKRLIVLNPEEKREVGALELLEPLFVSSHTTLMDLLYQFSSGKSHLAIITSDPDRVLHALRTNTVVPVNVHMAGIVTLEDVIERLIKHDIQDESDMTVRSQERRQSTLENSEMGSQDGESRPSPSVVPFSGVRPGYAGPASDDLRSIHSPGLFSSSSSPAPRINSHARSTPKGSQSPASAMKASLSVPLLAKPKP